MSETVWKTRLELVTTIVVLVAAALLIYKTLAVPSPAPAAAAAAAAAKTIVPPEEPLSLDHAELIGSVSAPRGIVIFTDFQCPYCAKFAREVWPALHEQEVKTGRTIVAFQHLPLVEIHPFAHDAAVGAVCADRMGRFMEFHDALFQIPKFDSSSVPGLVDRLQLRSTAFEECQRGDGLSAVAYDLELAKTLKLNATPRFFVGKMIGDRKLKVTKVIAGSRPLADYLDALAEAR